MSKISEQAAESFVVGNSFKNNNTRVEKVIGGVRMYLHDNLIAESVNGNLRITNANWPTVTTKSRLNSLPGVHIHQKDGQWFLNDKAWDGSWIKI